jgi:lipid-A-disaccharide synthase
MSPAEQGGLRLFLVVGEHSGDQLGFKLMRALREATGGAIAFSGVGGEAMAAEGLHSLFPLADIAVMGILPVIAKLPTLLARIKQTAQAAIAERPDALVIIDSPDFTHRVARRVRKALPDLPIVDYVSPSVWAWRPGRARTMRAYVDCLLALLPFEPDAHRRLGGPPCFYVGHPLIERLGELRPNAWEAARRAGAPPLIVILPGSRRTIIRRLMEDFGAALDLLAREIGPFEAVLPTMPHLAAEIGERVAKWPVKPRIVLGEAAKLAAFRNARAALAASGTVTLELALSGVPMVGAYKVSWIETPLKYVVKVPSILLPNLILGERAIPEFLQEACTPEKLAAALAGLVREGAVRAAQLQALARLDALMRLPDGDTPSARAARLVLQTVREGAGAPLAVIASGAKQSKDRDS